MKMQFDHVGITTSEEKPGESYVPATRVWRTSAQEHPFRIEWLRFEADSPVPQDVREMPHVAYRVDDIEASAKGMEVLLEPFDVGPRIVGFYRTADGAVVEFVKYKDQE
jgi:hypothetical protein